MTPVEEQNSRSVQFMAAEHPTGGSGGGAVPPTGGGFGRGWIGRGGGVGRMKLGVSWAGLGTSFVSCGGLTALGSVLEDAGISSLGGMYSSPRYGGLVVVGGGKYLVVVGGGT